jgi:hypothetical protein
VVHIFRQVEWAKAGRANPRKLPSLYRLRLWKYPHLIISRLLSVLTVPLGPCLQSADSIV